MIYNQLDFFFTIGRICEKNAKKNLYAYRLGGDEFTLLVVNGNDDEIKKVISQIKADLKNTEYYCSVGYAIKENDSNESLDELLRRAEMYMYLDKEEFYKDAKFERRKQPK